MVGDRKDNRLDIILLSGYLGSGKTTWLRHSLFEKRYGEEVLVFVQEAAEQPVDDLLLDAACGLKVLTGKAGTPEAKAEMITALLDLAEARTGGKVSNQVNTLIIETSGLANPAEIIEAIREHPILVHHFALRETIIMSDAVHFRTALETDTLCQQQILSADRIVISKAEEQPEQAVSNMVATVSKLNTSVPITFSSFGVEYPVPDLPPATETYQSPHSDNKRSIAVVSMPMPSEIDWIEFTIWLSALLHARGERIMRVKGVLQTDVGALLLQSVRKTMQQPEILPVETNPDKPSDIVFIGEDLDATVLENSLFKFLAKDRSVERVSEGSDAR